jgi:hypothetical protein
LAERKLNYTQLADLEFNLINFSKVTIFLGFFLDYQEALKELEKRKLTPDSPGPWAIKTVLG